MACKERTLGERPGWGGASYSPVVRRAPREALIREGSIAKLTLLAALLIVVDTKTEEG